MAWRASYRPLHVRAHLRTPVVSDRWLPLDGVLFYQCARQTLGDRVYSIAGASPPGDVHKIRVPIGMEHDGTPNWYYKCSWAQWPSHTVEAGGHWNKRFDNSLAYLVDFGGKRGKVDNNSGTFKAYHMPVFYRAALYVDWYCVGDETDIKRLLSAVTHLGKKTVQGWGRVARWEVEAIPEDVSVWDNGRLMRGIPVEFAPGGHPTAFYGVRPSYWMRQNQMLLAMPE